MKNLNFTNSCTINMNWNIYTFENSVKTINSNNCAKFEVNWPRSSQFTARHTKNRLQFDEQVPQLWNENSKFHHNTAGNRHKQNSWFCKEICEDNFRFLWRRVHEDASQGMYMSKNEILFFTARILQIQRMLCCGECFHD